MRITFQYQSMRYQNQISTSLNAMMIAQEKSQKGSAVLNPEDSPSRYISAYNLDRIIHDTNQYNDNAENASGWLTETERVIMSTRELISKVRNELAIYGANGTNNLEAMEGLAGDVQEIYQQLFDLANTPYMGRYIFGGQRTDSLPFKSSENTVNSLAPIYGQGGDVLTREVFGDLKELDSGKYTVQVDVKGDTGYLRLYDSKGQLVVLDSNGSDDTATNSNNIGTEMSFRIEPGKIINTGRGISIKLPENMNIGLRYEFNYVAGSNASYYGDDGIINNLIGFNQSVGINFTGRELFLQNNKILKSTQFNTVNGVALTISSLFSQIDKAKAAIGDSIRISGTDHQGFSVGAAKVLGADEVKPNMLNASREERTLTIGYGGKFYQIEIPAKGYSSMQELTDAVNHQLSKAVYAGSQHLNANYTSADALTADIQGKAAGLTATTEEFDLSKYIQVTADGSRLNFATIDTGNHTILSVSGYKHSPLGFDDKTITGIGKDTVFEMGYDFEENGINTLTTTNENLDLGVDQTFIINGEPLRVSGLGTAVGLAAKEALIDRALQEAGYGMGVTAHLTALGGGMFDVTFSMQNMNYDRTTHLSTAYYDGNDVVDYQMASLPKNITGNIKEKTVGDYMNFVKELYGNAVDVRIDNGRIVVEDLRSGQSRLSMNVYEGNEGISLPMIDQNTIVKGAYSGINDDIWNVEMSTTHEADNTKTVAIQVRDSTGKLIVDKTVNNYLGGDISLGHGVYVVADDLNTATGPNPGTSTFYLELTGKSSLSLGDMNVVQNGENANMFTSLMNLTNALNNEITNLKKGAPSLWFDETMRSSAIPYFDVVVGGNFNANWRYEVEPTDSQTDFYVQNMFTQTSGNIKYDPSFAGSTLSYAIQVFDNDTGQFTTHNVSLPMNAAITNDATLQQAILDTINKNQTLYNQGLHAYADGGKIVFESGSGAKTIAIVPQDQTTMYAMGVQEESKTALKTEFTANATMTYNYFSAGAWQTATMTIPAGNYATTTAVLAAVTTAPSPLVGGATITPTLVDGKLSFNSNVPFYYDNVVNPGGALGMNNNTMNYMAGDKTAPLDMTNTTDAQRTLKFRYNTGGVDITASIVLEPKAYDNQADLVTAINEKLTAQGLNTVYTAVQYGDKIAFEADPSVVHGVVEGDDKGYLGFNRIGDKVKLKVIDEHGKSIQNLTVDTANKEYGVSDGLILGFDRGTLFATDYFTGTVGSGVRFEIGILDMVESQLAQCITKVGNRSGRVESVMNLTTSITTNYENQKQMFLNATPTDKIKLDSNYTMATSAYEYALSIVSRALSISILDYLR